MAGATWNCSRLGASPVYTMRPCTMSLQAKPHTWGVCVFSCNLPPALLAEWPGSFTCYRGNTACYCGGTNTERFDSASALLFSSRVMVCGHCLVTLSTQLIKHQNGSYRCQSKCRSHSGGDRVALDSLPLPPPPGISVPSSTSSPTSWNLGPRQYLFPHLLESRSLPVPLPPPPGISVPASTSSPTSWDLGPCQYLFGDRDNSALVKQV